MIILLVDYPKRWDLFKKEFQKSQDCTHESRNASYLLIGQSAFKKDYLGVEEGSLQLLLLFSVNDYATLTNRRWYES